MAPPPALPLVAAFSTRARGCRQEPCHGQTGPSSSSAATSTPPPQNSSPGSPPNRVLRSICAVPTHAVVLVFGTAPCRVIALRSSTVYEPHFAGSAQPQHRRRSPSERNPVFCVEKKASRSTLVDVRSDAQSRIAIILTNTV
ncbi:hypothetical protein Zm00014a_034498 [Zea mays]|uniref:Uncharacterized protein n=1 Tax=Zea mays TaxID=4577 RepID=A0A3L6E517_MAIZE|nr:hypothetical protein Zm00014a_034498 [Zea mays]